MIGIGCLMTTFLHGRVAPRLTCLVGGALGGICFIIASRAQSLAVLALFVRYRVGGPENIWEGLGSLWEALGSL